MFLKQERVVECLTSLERLFQTRTEVPGRKGESLEFAVNDLEFEHACVNRIMAFRNKQGTSIVNIYNNAQTIHTHPPTL